MDASLRDYLDRLADFWDDFEPTTDAERAAQADISILTGHLEKVDDAVASARNAGCQEGFEMARKMFEPKPREGK